MEGMQNDTQSEFFTSSITQGGVYAVIFKPKSDISGGQFAPTMTNDLSWYERWKAIIWSAVVALLVAIAVLMLLIRQMMQYRTKLKTAVQQNKELEQRVEHMEIEMNTMDLVSNPLHQEDNDGIDIIMNGKREHVQLQSNPLHNDVKQSGGAADQIAKMRAKLKAAQKKNLSLENQLEESNERTRRALTRRGTNDVTSKIRSRINQAKAKHQRRDLVHKTFSKTKLELRLNEPERNPMHKALSVRVEKKDSSSSSKSLHKTDSTKI